MGIYELIERLPLFLFTFSFDCDCLSFVCYKIRWKILSWSFKVTTTVTLSNILFYIFWSPIMFWVSASFKLFLAPSSHSATECDFESDSCGWYEFTHGDGFDWVRGSSADITPDYFDHPALPDHSTNSTKGWGNASALKCSNADM